MKIVKKNIRIKYDNICIVDTTYDLVRHSIGFENMKVIHHNS